MSTIKDRNGIDLTEAEDIKKRWQEYGSGLPVPSPGDLPDSGIEPWSPTLQADSLPSEPPWKPPKQKCLQILPHVPLVKKSSTISIIETETD